MTAGPSMKVRPRISPFLFVSRQLRTSLAGIGASKNHEAAFLFFVHCFAVSIEQADQRISSVACF
jgi:hypothetical protein